MEQKRPLNQFNERLPVERHNIRPLDGILEDEPENIIPLNNVRNLSNISNNKSEEIKMSRNSLKKQPISKEEFFMGTGSRDESTMQWFERKIETGQFSTLKIVKRLLGDKEILAPVEDLFQEYVIENSKLRNNGPSFYKEIGAKIPNSLFNKRAILTTSNSDSSGLVANIIRPDLIEPLNTNKFTDRFTTVQTDKANVQLGDSETLPEPVVLIEGEAGTPTEPTFVSLNSTPKIISQTITNSREFFICQSEDTFNLLVNDTLDAIDVKLGSLALYGSGTDGEPTGLNENSGLQTLSGTSFSHTTAVTMENTAEINNAKSDRIYLMHPDTKKTLKLREKVSSTGKFIITPDNKMNGYPVLTSTSCLDSDIWFGDFSSIIMVVYGLAFEIDIVRLGVSGAVTVQFFVYRDVIVRNGASFVKAENFS